MLQKAKIGQDIVKDRLGKPMRKLDTKAYIGTLLKNTNNSVYRLILVLNVSVKVYTDELLQLNFI